MKTAELAQLIVNLIMVLAGIVAALVGWQKYLDHKKDVVSIKEKERSVGAEALRLLNEKVDRNSEEIAAIKADYNETLLEMVKLLKPGRGSR